MALRHAARARLPDAFFAFRWVERLNVVAVGAALSSATVALFGWLLAYDLTLVFGLPTFLFGCAWAALLRWDVRNRPKGRRLGWIASAPLAAVNAGTTAALLMETGGRVDFVRALAGFAVGATVGAVVWIPMLLFVLVVFGWPIAKGQRLAERGLLGAERGEMLVATACTTIAAASLVAALPELGLVVHHARPGVNAAGAVAIVAASVALVAAWRRKSQRLRFVADVEAGEIAGYRVDDTDEGKALVRVDARGEGYRVADFERELVRLDMEGNAEAEIASEERAIASSRRA